MSPNGADQNSLLRRADLSVVAQVVADMERPQKRRLEDEEPAMPESLTRPISPPNKKRRSSPVIRSPWQLTWIRDLPDDQNRDAVTLKDLLGDPLISECWEFNYLHDIHFLMDGFDSDVKHLVKVHVVHGFWKQEDPNRLALVVGHPFRLDIFGKSPAGW